MSAAETENKPDGAPTSEGEDAANQRPLIILVDMDDVLTDFEGEFYRKWTALHPNLPSIPVKDRRAPFLVEEYPQEYRDEVRAIFNAPGFIRNLPVVPGAIEALRAMKEAGHIVKICTAPLRDNPAGLSEKQAWIEEHLGHDWLTDFICEKDKTLTRGDVLIDDKPEVAGSVKPSWQHIVFSAPYNQGTTELHRLENWGGDWQDVVYKTAEKVRAEERFMVMPIVFVRFRREIRRDGKSVFQSYLQRKIGIDTWTLTGGHLEDGEKVRIASAREAGEEAGVTISEANLQLRYIAHLKDNINQGIGLRGQRICYFFDAWNWTGNLMNMEPDKVEECDWFDDDSLPPMKDATKKCLDSIAKLSAGRIGFGEYGWDEELAA